MNAFAKFSHNHTLSTITHAAVKQMNDRKRVQAPQTQNTKTIIERTPLFSTLHPEIVT
jgi:hypothetical protein